MEYKMNSWTIKYDYPKEEEVRDLGPIALQVFLEERYNLKGHPKASKLYEIAWDEGHAYGCYEVVHYYVELAELLEERKIL
jgi:hypothetical protein